MAALEKQLQEKSSAYSQAALTNTELQNHLQVQNTCSSFATPKFWSLFLLCPFWILQQLWLITEFCFCLQEKNSTIQHYQSLMAKKQREYQQSLEKSKTSQTEQQHRLEMVRCCNNITLVFSLPNLKAIGRSAIKDTFTNCHQFCMLDASLEPLSPWQTVDLHSWRPSLSSAVAAVVGWGSVSAVGDGTGAEAVSPPEGRGSECSCLATELFGPTLTGSNAPQMLFWPRSRSPFVTILSFCFTKCCWNFRRSRMKWVKWRSCCRLSRSRPSSLHPRFVQPWLLLDRQNVIYLM